jgi:DNA polymerase III epsilon subunit-like protein
LSKEMFISVDVESSGPVPGIYSMLSLGACVVGSPETSFYVELRPISDAFVAEALKVSKLSLDELKRTGRDPEDGMADFKAWILGQSVGRVPVFVGFNASFDWSFVNWYFHKFVGENPFGYTALDVKSYYMGRFGSSWEETKSSRMSEEFRPRSTNTHNALDDARSQATTFASLLKFRS